MFFLILVDFGSFIIFIKFKNQLLSMKVGKGTVKKYSREYSRTLKNGEKKIYKTEQIQITIPKSEDIFQDHEDVLIIPNSEIDNFNKINGMSQDLTYVNDEYESLKESYDNIIIKYDQLKQQNLNTKTSYAELYEIFENLEKEYESLLNEYNDLIDMFNELSEESWRSGNLPLSASPLQQVLSRQA